LALGAVPVVGGIASTKHCTQHAARSTKHLSEPVRPAAVPPDISEALARLRAASRIQPNITFFESVPSTNDIAARLADSGAPHLTVVVADQQTAGRGRLGRTWFSPPGAGLYASFVLRLAPVPLIEPGPFIPTEESEPVQRLTRTEIGPGPILPLVSLTAGVAFAEAVRTCTHLPVNLKWPNDLVVERRKLAGILTESSGHGAFDHAVVGFGLNLRSAAYPREIADRATSVEGELGRPVDRGAVLAQCCDAIASWTDALLAGKARAILDRWLALAPSARGARVRWTAVGGPHEGVTEGIDDDGALLVHTQAGIERIIAGEVTWLY
jgi:BirA family biotin operon repressor/biotin-[acetyl-CoA-carboxylase] ligase